MTCAYRSRRPTVVVSGGFDPIHIGHMRLIKAARQIGNVVVILNNDGFLQHKKGFVFMPQEERKEIIESVRGVSLVTIAIDDDQTINKTLELVRPDIFANGGDVTIENLREKETCERLGIRVVFGVGGDKVQSSSSLVRRYTSQ